MWYVFVTTPAGRTRLPGSWRTKRDAENAAQVCRTAIANLLLVEIVKGLKQ